MLKLINIALGAGALGASLVTAHLAIQTHDNGTRQGADGRTERTYDGNVSASGAQSLDIQAPIAAVELETGRFSDVSVHAVRWTKNPDTPAGKRWLQDGRFTVTRSGDTVTVHDEFKDRNQHDGEGNFNGGMEIHVKAPAGMRLNIQLGVGSVKPRGDLKSADIHVGAGNVEGRFGIEGSSEIHVGAGRVALSLPGSENLDINAHAGVGSIKGLPESASRPGRIHIGDNRSGRFGSGGSSLSINVGAGDIQIDSPAAAKSLSVESSGSRQQKLDSEDMDMGDMDINLPDVGPIVDNALAASSSAMAHVQADGNMSDIGPAIEEAMKQVGPTLEKTLSQIGPTVDAAMRQAQPDMDKDMAKEMAKIGPEIDKAMRQMKPELDKSMKDLGPELKREMEKIRPEIERARREARQSIDKAMPQIEKAMREAEAGIDKAEKEFTRNGSRDKKLDESTRRMVQESLKAAREAIKMSMAEARKAIDQAKRDKD